MKNKTVNVRKMNGELAPFDSSKLRKSLDRSKASEEVIDKVIGEVEALLYEGIGTKEIYRKAFSILKKTSSHTAARFSLKKAIYGLGPSGFPFERLVGEILVYQGFQTKLDVIVQGKCVTHEVDVVADKGQLELMVECKFHGDRLHFCDVKVPLYIHSRFRDIEQEWSKLAENKNRKLEGWIFTNTRFTADAVRYGNCANLKLVGWDHPKGEGLQHLIDLTGLHPITCLTTLTLAEKSKFIKQEKILCKELLENPRMLNRMNISTARQDKILDEAKSLCNGQIATK
ncbi:MAG: ATPase [Flavobacteriales bacterium]|nr:ATPase [Flavobacteriales bacterium]